MEYNTVRNGNTLKAMEKRGLIKFHHQTLSKITGLYSKELFTCYYVDDGPYNFEYKGESYGCRYFDGCFFPYVVKL